MTNRHDNVDQHEEEEILKQSVIEDEGLEAPGMSLAEKLQEQKKAHAKKRRKKIIWSCSALLFALLLWYLFKPFKSSAEYGVCRTLLELKVPYPYTLHVGEMKILRDGGMRLYYSYIDGFGESRNEIFTCYIRTNPETGKLELDKIKMRKIDLGREEIASLRQALVYFDENPLILNWPAPLPNNLSDLHFDSDMFRIQLNITKR